MTERDQKQLGTIRGNIADALRHVESLKRTAQGAGTACHQVDVIDGRVIASPEND